MRCAIGVGNCSRYVERWADMVRCLAAEPQAAFMASSSGSSRRGSLGGGRGLGHLSGEWNGRSRHGRRRVQALVRHLLAARFPGGPISRSSQNISKSSPPSRPANRSASLNCSAKEMDTALHYCHSKGFDNAPPPWSRGDRAPGLDCRPTRRRHAPAPLHPRPHRPTSVRTAEVSL